jgi:hypothetical protein
MEATKTATETETISEARLTLGGGGMTRRERALARLERRREWAEGRRQKAAACYAVGDPYRGDIAFNTQPGHIPERARVIAATERSFAHSDMAAHHEGKAAGTERMLAHTVFSDDADATEQLRAKIEKKRALVERMKAANKLVRKYKSEPSIGIRALVGAGFTESQAALLFQPDFAGRVGFPSYALTNEGANIRRMEARITEIEDMRARQARTESAPGGVIIEGSGPGEFGDWVSITFAEKPEREILDALKAAGFRWGGGSWSGERAKIPASVQEQGRMTR